MDPRDTETIISLLRDIRDGQKLALERQAELLARQQERFAAIDAQTGRASQIQDRAEKIQAVSGRIVSGVRWILIIVIPLLLVLVAFLMIASLGRYVR